MAGGGVQDGDGRCRRVAADEHGRASTAHRAPRRARAPSATSPTSTRQCVGTTPAGGGRPSCVVLASGPERRRATAADAGVRRRRSRDALGRATSRGAATPPQARVQRLVLVSLIESPRRRRSRSRARWAFRPEECRSRRSTAAPMERPVRPAEGQGDGRGWTSPTLPSRCGWRTRTLDLVLEAAEADGSRPPADAQPPTAPVRARRVERPRRRGHGAAVLRYAARVATLAG